MDPILQPLVIYGPLGIFAAFGLWFLKQVYEGAVKDRNSEREYSRSLEKTLREQVLPLLSQVQLTTAEAVKVITEAQAELRVRKELQ